MATARNEVPRPAFRAGDTAVDPWNTTLNGSGLAAADRGDAPFGNRAAWTHTNGRAGKSSVAVPLPGLTWTPGMAVSVLVSLWYSKNTASPYRVWLMPDRTAAFDTGDDDGSLAGSPLDAGPGTFTGAHYSTTTGTVEAAPAGYAWKDRYGGALPDPTGGPVWLGIGLLAGVGSSAVSHVRVGEDPEQFAGYFDGSTDPVDGWTFSWDGDPGVSTSTATGPDPEPPLPVDDDGELDLGAEVQVPVWVMAGSPAGVMESMTGLPPGLTPDGDNKVATGTPTDAGAYTVTLRAVDEFDYPGPVVGSPVSLTVVDPDPEPDPDPDPEDPVDPTDPDPWDEWDELTTRLAPRVAAYVGRPGDADTTATASAQLPVVAEYVRGYTRGRGFEGERPAAPLRAVIVAATARLATNPEQVTVFTTGDYSERPAILAGWTLTELGVLRRYRRTTA